jgi:Zn-dependent peptidase ImmA (M78 family)/transcriptional regulator with XRE-family HTH domain
MPAPDIQPKVSPSVLAWARETSGLTPSEAGRRLGVEDSRVLRWERGEEAPSVPKLAELAEAYHRPLAVFLLQTPPNEPPAPPDLRVIGSAYGELVFSEKTLLAIRRARRVQQLTLRLEPGHNARRLQKLQQRLVGVHPEDAASVLAVETGAYTGSPPRFENPYKALSHWRRLVEALGVLALQFPMPIEDTRGFTLPDPKCPALVINQSDVPRARVFTLFHELGHILQRREGVCDLGAPAPETRVPPVESWCNAFAGAFLVPTKDFLTEWRQWPKGEDPPDEEIRRLSSRYQVSETVVLRRLLAVGAISASQYRTGANRRSASFDRPKPAHSQEVKRNIPSERVAEFGSSFVRLVLSSASSGELTLGDVADILDVRVKHLSAISDRIARLSAET